jgi:DNA-binding transcriptional regulator GbsR (MarR family)
MDTHAKPSAIDQFIEQMGLISQADGSPRIAGRLFGLLLIEARPMPLHEIADRLQISRASASTNARLLASRNIIQLTAHAGDRQDYYQLAATDRHYFLDEIAVRMRKSATVIGAFAEPVASESEAAGARVRELAEFFDRSADFVAEWSRHFKSKS